MKRIAIKIGSNVLARRDGTLDITRMSALVDQVVSLRRAGMEVVMISSGAVAAGRSEMRGVDRLSVLTTSVTQRGSLPVYVGTIFVVVVAAETTAGSADRMRRRSAGDTVPPMVTDPVVPSRSRTMPPRS